MVKFQIFELNTLKRRMSMDEMEKEIENEMMNNAATKIQAGFRGFKTRKEIHSQYGSEGVSKRETMPQKSESGDKEGESKSTEASLSSECASAAAALANAEGLSDQSGLGAVALASREGRKPSLGALRSFSFPGSGSHDDPILLTAQDEEHVLIPTAISQQDVALGFVDEVDEDRLFHIEPQVELDLDPDYINKAATRIQANFRGYQVRKSFKRPSSGTVYAIYPHNENVALMFVHWCF